MGTTGPIVLSPPEPVRLAEHEWLEQRRRHEERVDDWTLGHAARRRAGVSHPVEDFLFTYYAHRPTRLRRWSPGPGVVLDGPAARLLLNRPDWVAWRGGVALTRDVPDPRRRTAAFVVDLLQRTAGRPGWFGCFGLHEWAMVYRRKQDEVRHAAWPLRLGEEGTARVVEGSIVRCSHFDAFRFFTPEARPLNQLQPTRETQLELEQPGCLHATMDLYKWAYKLSPWIDSALVADGFALARDVRELDMRASPYDLRVLGYSPVAIETAEGRAEYAMAQRAFAERAAVLRPRVADAARLLLDWAGRSD